MSLAQLVKTMQDLEFKPRPPQKKFPTKNSLLTHPFPLNNSNNLKLCQLIPLSLPHQLKSIVPQKKEKTQVNLKIIIFVTKIQSQSNMHESTYQDRG